MTQESRPVRFRGMLCARVAVVSTFLSFTLSAHALPIFAGNTYDPVTNTGIFAQSGQLGPARINNVGIAVGNGGKRSAGVSEGWAVVRWSPTLVFEELGSLGVNTQGSSFPKATAINDAGVVVGSAGRYSETGASLGTRPVRWDVSSTSAVELLLGGDPTVPQSGGATGIDAAGNISGSRGAAAPFPTHWSGGSTNGQPMQTLGAPSTGSGTGSTSFVAANGTIAGMATLYNAGGAPTGSRAVRWTAGGDTPVAFPLQNNSSPKLAGINDHGAVIGNFGSTAVYYAPQSTDAVLLTHLGAGIAGAQSSVNGVGNNGAIIGTSSKYIGGVFAYTAPVVWATPTSAPVELFTDPAAGARTRANAVNGSGHAVGETYDLAQTPALIKPWLWSSDGSGVAIQSFVDTPGWSIRSALDISDTGWIVGEAFYDPDQDGPLAGYARFYSVLVPSAGTYGIGDATFDGKIDFDDLLLLAQHYNQPSAGRVDVGDLDLNGTTGFEDLLALAQHYSHASESAFSADWAMALSLAPEPTGLTVVIAAAVTGGRRRRC